MGQRHTDTREIGLGSAKRPLIDPWMKYAPYDKTDGSLPGEKIHRILSGTQDVGVPSPTSGGPPGLDRASPTLRYIWGCTTKLFYTEEVSR